MSQSRTVSAQSLELEPQYIAINGTDHHYQWVRSSQDASVPKPVMVFLHGWGGSGRYWESTAAALSDSFDCLLYDLRGFGRSTRSSNASTDLTTDLAVGLAAKSQSYELIEYAHDLKQLLDYLGLDRVYLNAHSTGASIAVLFLNAYPERVERAVLTCSGIFEYNERAFTTFHRFSRYVVAFRPQWLAKIPLMDRFFMARFLHRSLPSSISKAFLEDFLMADFDAAYGTVLTAVSKAAATWMPEEFKRLTVPTLLVAGEYDQIIPAKMGKAAADLSPQVEFSLIEKTAHFPMLEDASTYLQRVRQFLEMPIS